MLLQEKCEEMQGRYDELQDFNHEMQKYYSEQQKKYNKMQEDLKQKEELLKVIIFEEAINAIVNQHFFGSQDQKCKSKYRFQYIKWLTFRLRK